MEDSLRGDELKEVVILPELRYHTIEGWGQGSMDQANVPWFTSLSDAERERLLDLLYTLNDGGLGLNVCRHYVWGGDDPTHEHMWRGPGSKKCVGFEMQPGHFVWDGHESSLWHARGALKRGAKMVAFWNSPPYWMTVTGCSSGSKKKGDNNLRDDMVERFAEHICNVLEHYRDGFGIPFDYVSPINEPDANWWDLECGQEGCCVNARQAIEIISSLRKALDKRGMNLPIHAPEAGHSSSLNYLDELLNNDAARGAIHTLACHQYFVDDRSLFLWAQKTRRAGKPLWMSEWGDWENRGIAQALNYAMKIHQAHRVMSADVWCMWEPSFLFDEREGRLIPRHSFFAVAHYSRFLRPGSRMIEALAPTIKVNAYLDEANATVIAIAVNATGDDISIPFDFSRFEGLSDVDGRRTSANEMLAQFVVARPGERFRLILPKRSITTLSAKYRGIRPTMIQNPGFETGDAAGWTIRAAKKNSAGVEDNYTQSGNFNGFLHVDSDGGSALSQQVSGLKAGTKYLLGAACATSGIPARFGVRQGGKTIFAEAKGGSYRFPVVEFVAEGATAEIFYECDAEKSQSNHWATIDSVFLKEFTKSGKAAQ